MRLYVAGSTVMLLTIAWGGSLWVGRCDLDTNGVAKNKTLTRKWDLYATGITTDRATTLNAWIMIASCLCFLPVRRCRLNTHQVDPGLKGTWLSTFQPVESTSPFKVLVVFRCQPAPLRRGLRAQRVGRRAGRRGAGTGKGSLLFRI